jgi:tetratricopeptide (TPR) repeat protein
VSNPSQNPDNKLVVFAGAGVSMVAPSSLPNWWAFNEVVVAALARRLSAYTRQSIGDSALRTLIERRDGSTTFAPDYMADLAAEEVGEDYFSVLQALDTDQYNANHALVADLAAAGHCAAVITTNFDRLFERAFETLGAPYEAFYSPEHFERLSERLAEGGPTPIIKVHGSAEAPDTMVDTLSQRLRGRPKPLEDALRALYAQHHLLFLGFSGADLDYDPNYLGLRDAAASGWGPSDRHHPTTNRGFTYLALSLDKIKPSISELAHAWGPAARIVEGRLPGWLAEFAHQFGVEPGELPDDSVAVDRLPDVAAAADAWAESLGDLQATNVLSAFLRASGDDAKAGYLYYSVWRHYRGGRDAEDPAYGRLNHHMGRYLREYGWTFDTLRPPTAIVVHTPLQGDPELAALDRDKLDNAFQFLARAYKEYQHVPSLPELAICYALMGDVAQAIDIIGRLMDAAVEAKHPPTYVDAVIAGGTVWSIGGVWTDGLRQLEGAHKLASSMGQETRRAQVLAHLVRFLAWKERHEEAERAYREGLKIVSRLGMEGARLRLQSSWGYALSQQGRSEEGLAVLLPVIDDLQRTGRLADLTRAALDLFQVAYGLWEQEPIERAFTLLEEFEPGYKPHTHLAYAEFYLKNEQYEQALAHVEQARTAGQQTHNEWAGRAADALGKEIERRKG